VLYPSAAAVMVLSLIVGFHAPSTVTQALMWLLPVPMVIEWTVEHLRFVRYSPRRQVAVTLIGAPSLGLALATHLIDPFSGAAVAPMLTWAGVCAVTAFVGQLRGDPQEWERQHESSEQARLERLRSLAQTDRLH